MAVARFADDAGLEYLRPEPPRARAIQHVLSVVDSRPLIRCGLTRLAEAATGCRVQAYSDLSRVRASPALAPTSTSTEVRIGTMLLGLRKGDDVEALVQTARHRANVVIGVLDGDDAEVIDAALGANADGYVLVDLLDESTLREVVAAAGAGECPIPDELGGPWRRPGARDQALSRRALEVIGLLAEGLHDEEIAGQLGIGASSVRKHILSAQARLRARTRTQAVATAARRGLL